MTVTGDFPGPAIRRDLAMRDMDGLDPSAVLPNHERRGLTRTDWEIATDVSTRDLQNGPINCVSLAAVQVSISYKTLEILIDKDIPEDSCMYREILAHEQQHVQVRADAHIRLKELLKQALSSSSRLPTSRKPLAAKNQEDSRQKALAAAQALVDEASAVVAAEALERNVLLDSPESYAALSARCPR